MADDIDIPDELRELLQDDELTNMRNRDGWATGTAVRVEDGEVGVDTIEDAWVELFNGDGTAGEFTGVRFMAVQDGSYTEAYAYATPETFEANGGDSGWYIESYNEDNVDYHPLSGE